MTNAEREKAWQATGITMFRPPTPKELREVFDNAFDAGYAAGHAEWVAIRGEDNLPKVEGDYLVWTIRTEQFDRRWFNPNASRRITEWLEDYSHWQKITPPQGENQ